MPDPPQLPPAGWHPDPEQPQTWRWWDGTQWTEQRAPMQAPTPQEAGQDRSPLAAVILNHLVWSALIALFAIAIVVGALSPEEDAAPSTTTEKADKPDKPEPPEITAAMVVDASFSPKDIDTACKSVDTLGYEVSLSLFKEGFGDGSGEISATEAFDEVLTRC